MMAMSNFDECSEQMSDLIERMVTKNDFWEGSHFPEKVGFQRFGLQLREEDLDQNGDLSETAKANSGFSVVTNKAGEFKVELDVWPFKKDDLSIFVVGDKYVVVKGEHDERKEDNSYCSRSFKRHYMLPRGSVTRSADFNYCNGILTFTFKKGKVARLQAKPVPITLESNVENKGVLSEVICKSSTPTEVQQLSSYDTVSKVSEPAIEVPSVGREPVTDYERALVKDMYEVFKRRVGNDPKFFKTFKELLEVAGLPIVGLEPVTDYEMKLVNEMYKLVNRRARFYPKAFNMLGEVLDAAGLPKRSLAQDCIARALETAYQCEARSGNISSQI